MFKLSDKGGRSSGPEPILTIVLFTESQQDRERVEYFFSFLEKQYPSYIVLSLAPASSIVTFFTFASASNSSEKTPTSSFSVMPHMAEYESDVLISSSWFRPEKMLT